MSNFIRECCWAGLDKMDKRKDHTKKLDGYAVEGPIPLLNQYYEYEMNGVSLEETSMRGEISEKVVIEICKSFLKGVNDVKSSPHLLSLLKEDRLRQEDERIHKDIQQYS
jgi:hypothetical protein